MKIKCPACSSLDISIKKNIFHCNQCKYINDKYITKNNYKKLTFNEVYGKNLKTPKEVLDKVLFLFMDTHNFYNDSKREKRLHLYLKTSFVRKNLYEDFKRHLEILSEKIDWDKENER